LHGQAEQAAQERFETIPNDTRRNSLLKDFSRTGTGSNEDSLAIAQTHSINTPIRSVNECNGDFSPIKSFANNP
jgi:hypothetical protein